MAEKLRLSEIAARIQAHLKRFEADPKINPFTRYDLRKGKRVLATAKDGTRPYFHVNAYQGGARVCIVYVNYQGPITLTRPQAEAYLAALDGGFVGTHFAVKMPASPCMLCSHLHAAGERCTRRRSVPGGRSYPCECTGATE